MAKQETPMIEQITIEQSFPYTDSNGDQKENWIQISQPIVETQIGQGRFYFGAKRQNPEISGLIITRQYIQGLDNNKKYRVTCNQGIFLVIWIINQRQLSRNELHLKKYPR
jgi:hypothetical protein